MCKVTEKCIKGMITEANGGVLKTWSFGLKAERKGDGFIVSKLFRQPGKKGEPLHYETLAAKETSIFIQGFLAAVDLANGGEGK